MLNEQIQRMRKLSGLNESVEKISDESVGYQSGQTDMRSMITVDGQVAAYVDYAIYKGEVGIKYIESLVPRQGYATKLMDHLIQQYGVDNIDLGMLTDDGSQLVQSLRQKYPDLGVPKEVNNHLPADALTKIKSQGVRRFAGLLYRKGNTVWESYRGVNDIDGYDLNDIADLVRWVQGSALNENRPEDEVPYPVMEFYRELTQ